MPSYHKLLGLRILNIIKLLLVQPDCGHVQIFFCGLLFFFFFCGHLHGTMGDKPLELHQF